VAVLVVLAVCVLVLVRLGGVRVLVRVRRVAAGMVVLMRRIVVRVLVRMGFFFVRVRMSMICHLRDSLKKAVSDQPSAFHCLWASHARREQLIKEVAGSETRC
jgi:hypothetical protein